MKQVRTSKIVILIFFLFHLAYADIPPPEQFLGFKIGTAKKLAHMQQIIDYFNLLDTASNRIKVEDVGETTEGNPFIVAFITSEKNHRNLETYRQYQQLLADPRKISDAEAEKIIRTGKTIVMINCSLHASEIGASQMSLQLAYDLAVSNDPIVREILDNVILILTPMHNPDGIQMVVDWYRKYLGTKYEGGRMPYLYHKYVGHDNNRDWYMFTQVETRLTIKVHNAWHPQIVVDMHQMGSRGARLFVPPYVDPYEPNVDPIIRQQVAMMGTFIASELTAQGKAGVIHSSHFDAWTPARAYHHYHGGVRILTECASVKIATPITLKFDDLSEKVKKPSVNMPLPWKGGEWTLQDIIEYDYAAAKAALINAARLRENWLRNFYRIHKKAVTRTDPPFAFLIPESQRDLPAAVNLINVLQTGGVEVHRATIPFKADGEKFSANTYIIYMAQPYGGFAKTLLEKQVYPEIKAYPGGPLKTPYDVVAHTLPLLMGVKTIQVDAPFETEVMKLSPIKKPQGEIVSRENAVAYVWGHATNDDIMALNRLLAKGYTVFWAAEKFTSRSKSYPAGTMIVIQKQGLSEHLRTMVNDLYVRFEGMAEMPSVRIYRIHPVRLALYKSWTGSMDEGWTRWVLQQYEFPFNNVFDEHIRAGSLNEKYDVIIFPDMTERAIVKGNSKKSVPPQYAGGIGKNGIKHIKEFVKNGGTLITLNSAADFALKHFDIPVQQANRKLTKKDFFIPGSILRVSVNPHHPIAYGYEKETAIFFRRSPVFDLEKKKGVLNYPSDNLLLSGWVNGEKYLSGKSALADVSVGKGKIVLIGFPAQYRGQSQGTFRFLFNSIYYGNAKLINDHSIR